MFEVFLRWKLFSKSTCSECTLETNLSWRILVLFCSSVSLQKKLVLTHVHARASIVSVRLPVSGNPGVHEDDCFPAVPLLGEAGVPGSDRGRHGLAGTDSEQARQHQRPGVLTPPVLVRRQAKFLILVVPPFGGPRERRRRGVSLSQWRLGLIPAL